jgi:hypothetical protein
MKRIFILALVVAVLAPATASWAEPAGQESTLGQIGTGAGSALGTIVYAPFKASFCILGGIGSGFTLLAAGPQTAGKVVGTTCRGTWVITPNAVRGKEPIRFIGDTRTSGIPQSEATG